MNPTNSIMASRIAKLIKKSIIGLTNIDYIVATSDTAAIPEESKIANMKTLEWNIEDREFIKDLPAVDLLIYRPTNSLMQQMDVNTQLTQLSNAVKVINNILIQR